MSSYHIEQMAEALARVLQNDRPENATDMKKDTINVLRFGPQNFKVYWVKGKCSTGETYEVLSEMKDGSFEWVWDDILDSPSATSFPTVEAAIDAMRLKSQREAFLRDAEAGDLAGVVTITAEQYEAMGRE